MNDADAVPVAQLCREVLDPDATWRPGDADQLRDRHDRTAPIDWRITPIETADGDVRGLVLTLRDVRATRRLEDSRHLALHDPLTGMKNRSYLEHLENRRAADAQAPSAVVFLDLDDFKAVNDTAGHEAGDAVPRQVADTIGHVLRQSDDLIRMGGDEFAPLLRDRDLEGAARIAETLVEKMEGRAFGWHGPAFRLGVSAGVAPAAGVRAAAASDAVSRADKACYRAKRAGGRRVARDDAR